MSRALVAPNCATSLWCEHGGVLAEAGKLNAAKEELLAALVDTERHGLKAVSRDVHASLSDILERQGDTARALRRFRQHHALERELHGEAADSARRC